MNWLTLFCAVGALFVVFKMEDSNLATIIILMTVYAVQKLEDMMVRATKLLAYHLMQNPPIKEDSDSG